MKTPLLSVIQPFVLALLLIVIAGLPSYAQNNKWQPYIRINSMPINSVVSTYNVYFVDTLLTNVDELSVLYESVPQYGLLDIEGYETKKYIYIQFCLDGLSYALCLSMDMLVKRTPHRSPILEIDISTLESKTFYTYSVGVTDGIVTCWRLGKEKYISSSNCVNDMRATIDDRYPLYLLEKRLYKKLHRKLTRKQKQFAKLWVRKNVTK